MVKFNRFAASIVALSLIVGLFSAVHPNAWAATAAVPAGSANGMRISPVRTDITIAPGKTSTVTVTVQNVTKESATLRAVVNDFVANANESGQPNLILDENQYAPAHSLKRFVAPIANFTLQPSEERQVKVNISVPENAAGGGYYGAVRFAPASAAGQKNVTLTASAGSLILVRVPGDIKEQLVVASIDVRQNNTAHTIFTNPDKLTAVVRFQNKGNIQVEPFGKLSLRNRSGVILSSNEINKTEPRGNVLPDSIRRFDVPVTKVGSFGKYKIEGNFGYGSAGQLITATTTFYVIPAALLIALGVVLLLIILCVIFVPKFIKRYNRRVLRKAHYR